MRRLFLASALALASCTVAMAQDVGGRYEVTGTNLDGSAYTGTAEISILSDTTCVIEWATGDTVSSGVCMRNGNAFSAAYTLGDALGLLIFQIMDDGSMDGLWTITGQDGTGTETLTPM